MKNKYKLEGIGKNKKILKERKKPLPIGLIFYNQEWLDNKEKYLKDKIGDLNESIKSKTT